MIKIPWKVKMESLKNTFIHDWSVWLKLGKIKEMVVSVL